MCGICGIINSNNPLETEQLLSMTRVLRHRGPDDEGFILGDTKKILLKVFITMKQLTALKAELRD